MSKTFNTINIHTLIRKLLQTMIPGTIMKFTENYIKGCKASTPYRNHHNVNSNLEGGVHSPTLYNIYTADILPPRAPVQVMVYADNMTITSTQTGTNAANKYIQPYLHKVFAWTKHSVHFRPCRIYEPSGPQNNKSMHYPWQLTQRFWALP